MALLREMIGTICLDPDEVGGPAPARLLVADRTPLPRRLPRGPHPSKGPHSRRRSDPQPHPQARPICDCSPRPPQNAPVTCLVAGTWHVSSYSGSTPSGPAERPLARHWRGGAGRARRWPTMVSMNTVIVGTGPVSFADVIAVARGGAAVELSPAAEAEISASRKVIDALAHDTAPHYGVSTGFGALATRHIPAERRAQLQRSLVRSHAAGSGPEVEPEVIRAMMLLRLSTLATGRTGVRIEVARAYAAMLSAGITPVVREYGSLGCSGDLAPLAHCALAAMGEGTVRVAEGRGGRDRRAARPREALAAAGIAPLALAEKEGLALINGTDGMLGMLRARRRRPARPAQGRGHHRRDVASRRCSAPTRRSTPGCRRCARTRGRSRPPPTCGRLLAGSPIVASHRGPGGHARPGRVLAALRAAGARRGPRHPRARGVGGGRRAGQRHRQPGGDRGRPRGLQRQLPRRAGRLRARLPGDRRRRRRLDRRAAHRPDARRGPLARAAAVPRRRPRASTPGT